MQISESQTDTTALSSFGAEAVQLLRSENFSELADRFSYALSFDREPSAAIREDFLSSLAELGATGLGHFAHSSTVKYFKPNDTGLFAVVECLIPTNDGSALLLELIVTSKGTDKYITLEQLSAAA